MVITAITLVLAALFRIPCIVMTASIIYLSYIIINGLRYTYGEDYMFSASYNIWCLLVLPNISLAYLLFKQNKHNKYWSWFYVWILAQTALIEKLQNQNVNADSYYFYSHIGMLNYPAFYVSIIILLLLLIYQIMKGHILNASTLFTSLSIFMSLLYSDNLFAFSLFFLSAISIQLVTIIHYTHYRTYRDENLDLANVNSFFREAEKKYPLKYSIALMYIDEYERLLKRFGENKTLVLKKMFLARIKEAEPDVEIYNYKPDALILAFKKSNLTESFEKAEDIRRLLAKSIFVFNENNHLQLTVSQCVSEKKRSDSNALAVLQRAEENLKKACKFTRNITIKA